MKSRATNSPEELLEGQPLNTVFAIVVLILFNLIGYWLAFGIPSSYEDSVLETSKTEARRGCNFIASKLNDALAENGGVCAQSFDGPAINFPGISRDDLTGGRFLSPTDYTLSETAAGSSTFLITCSATETSGENSHLGAANGIVFSLNHEEEETFTSAKKTDFLHDRSGSLKIAVFIISIWILINVTVIIKEMRKRRRWKVMMENLDIKVRPPISSTQAIMIALVFNFPIIVMLVSPHDCGNNRWRAMRSEGLAGCGGIATTLRLLLKEYDGVFETSLDGPAIALPGILPKDLNGAYFDAENYTISKTSTSNNYYLVTCTATATSGQGIREGIAEGMLISMDSEGTDTFEIPERALKESRKTELIFQYIAPGLLLSVMILLDALAWILYRRTRRRWQEALSIAASEAGQ